MEIKENKYLQKYYNEIFEIIDGIGDLETLSIGIEILKIARNRLDKDLDSDYIRNKYNELGKVINKLEKNIRYLYIGR